MDRVGIAASSWDMSGTPPNSLGALARDSSSPGGEESERETIRLKIYTDSLMRDLLAMEDALRRAQGIHHSAKPVVISPIPAMWTLGWTVTAVTVPVKAVVGMSVAGAVAGMVALAAPRFWHSIQSNSLEQIAVPLGIFKNAVANGADLTKYHNYLARERFAALEKVAAEIKTNHQCVLEA